MPVQLSASLKYSKDLGPLTKRVPETAGSLVVDSGVEEENRWVIQTKFETPMLNFNHITGPDHIDLTRFMDQAACVLEECGINMEEYLKKMRVYFMEVGPIPENWQKVVGVGRKQVRDHENQP